MHVSVFKESIILKMSLWQNGNFKCTYKIMFFNCALTTSSCHHGFGGWPRPGAAAHQRQMVGNVKTLLCDNDESKGASHDTFSSSSRTPGTTFKEAKKSLWWMWRHALTHHPPLIVFLKSNTLQTPACPISLNNTCLCSLKFITLTLTNLASIKYVSKVVLYIET